MYKQLTFSQELKNNNLLWTTQYNYRYRVAILILYNILTTSLVHELVKSWGLELL